jgi:DNA-binding NarL/FixJ family response regulator
LWRVCLLAAAIWFCAHFNTGQNGSDFMPSFPPEAKKRDFLLSSCYTHAKSTWPVMKSLRILIADDHALVRRGMRALLESQPGWTVIGEAVSGSEAVNLGLRLRPHICVLDYSMPEMNGLEVSEMLLKKLPGLKILMLSIHDSESIIERALTTGVYGYILKSDADRDVIEAVRALSENKPFFTSSAGAYVLRRMKSDKARGTSSPELTLRERQVIKQVAEGRSNKEIAASLHLSMRTVETHRANLASKLGLNSISALTKYAIRNKLTEL